MPRPKPNPRVRRFEISEAQKLFMFFGINDDDPDWSIQRSTWGGLEKTGFPNFEELWSAFGDELLFEYVFTLQNYGQRPPIWWKFSSPELRRQLNSSGRRAYEVPESGIKTFLTQCGVPLLWCDDHEPNPIFESQASYLRRLNLFLEGEEQHLTPPHFEPDVFGVDLGNGPLPTIAFQ